MTILDTIQRIMGINPLVVDDNLDEDYEVKYELYNESGLKLYITVYPDKLKIVGKAKTYTFNDTRSEVLEDPEDKLDILADILDSWYLWVAEMRRIIANRN